MSPRFDRPLSIQRSALECAIQCGDETIRFFSVHLTHLCSETRLPQVRELLRIHRQAAYEGLPVCGELKANPLRDGGNYWAEGVTPGEVSPHAVLLGDFNCTPDAPEYDLLVGPDSPYGGRVTHPDGFVDAWTHVGGDPKGGHTSDVKEEPARLDYCFVSASLRASTKGKTRRSGKYTSAAGMLFMLRILKEPLRILS